MEEAGAWREKTQVCRYIKRKEIESRKLVNEENNKICGRTFVLFFDATIVIPNKIEI